MEDFFKSLSLKNSTASIITLGEEGSHVTKAIYPLLLGTQIQITAEIKKLIEECEKYQFSEEDFKKEFPDEVSRKMYENDGRLYIFRKRYTNKFTELRFSNILYTTIVLEGLINHYLLGKVANQSQFKKLTSYDNGNGFGIREKWEISPTKLIPEYTLDSEDKENLNELINQRNKIVHNEPKITINTVEKHKGKLIQSHELNMTEQVLAFNELPKRLLENLFKYDQSAEVLNLKSLYEMTYKIKTFNEEFL